MQRKLYIFLALLVAFVVCGLPLLYAVQSERHLRNFHEVVAGDLYRSGQMAPAALARTINEYHIGTVISFRDNRDPDKPSPDEYEEELCNDRGVQYHRLSPLRWSEPDGSIPAQVNVDRFLEIINDPRTPRPILVHCFAGVHRTGAFVSIYRMERCGWSHDETIEEMFEIAGDRKVFDEDQLDYLRKYPVKSR